MKSYLVVALLAVSLSLVEPVPHHHKPLDKRFIKGLWDNWFSKSSEEEEVTETPAPQEPTPDCYEAEVKLKEWMDEHGDHTDKRFIKGLWNKWFGAESEDEEAIAEAPELIQPSPGDCADIEARLKELMEGHPDHEDEDFTTVGMSEDFFTSTSPHTTWMHEDTWMPEESTGDFTTPPPTTEPYTPDESEFFTSTSPHTTWMPDESTGGFTTPPPTSDPTCEDKFFNCADLAAGNKCETKPVVQQRCRKTCGLC